MEEFHPGINIIIGENGKGKSNFLSSISYLISTFNTHYTSDEKQAMFHGESFELLEHKRNMDIALNKDEDYSQLSKFSIEMVFNNENDYFPLETEEVKVTKKYDVLTNKEEIFINNKKLNSLEAEEFFNQVFLKNAYYLIKQGNISRLVQNNAGDLIMHFSEVIGVDLINKNEKSFLSDMKDINFTNLQINENLKETKQIVKALEVQKEELSKYLTIEEEKNMYEYIIFNHKKENQEKTLNEITDIKNKKTNSLKKAYTKNHSLNLALNNLNTKLFKIERTINAINSRISKTEEEILTLQNSKNTNIFNKEEDKLEKNKYELQRKNLNKDLEMILKEKADIENEINSINKEIFELNNNMSNSNSNGNNQNIIKANLISVNANLNKDSKISELKKLIENLSNDKEALNNKIDLINKSVKQKSEDKEKTENEIKQLADECGLILDNNNQLSSLLESLKKERLEFSKQIKAINLSINELESGINVLKEDSESKLKNTPYYELYVTVNKIIEKNIPGVLGIVFDFLNIRNIPENLRLAVELVGKDKLFAIIVDNQQTALKVIEENNSNKGPVIKVFPIDIIMKEYSNITVPNISNSESLSLMKIVHINKEYLEKQNLNENEIEPIRKMLFHKSIVVSSLEIGNKLSKEYKVDCITSKNEIIKSGAYIFSSTKKSKKESLSSYLVITENLRLMRKNTLEIKTLTTSKEELFTLDSGIINKTQDILLEKQKINTSYVNNRKLIQEKSSYITSLEKELEDLIRQSESMTEEERSIENEISIIDEIANKLNKNQSINISEKEMVNDYMQSMNNKLDYERKKIILDERKIKLESHLNNQILKKEQELNNEIKNINDINGNNYQNTKKNRNSSIDANSVSTKFSLNEDDIKFSFNLVENIDEDIKQLQDSLIKMKNDKKLLEAANTKDTEELEKLKILLEKDNDALSKEEAEVRVIKQSFDSVNDIYLSLKENSEALYSNFSKQTITKIIELTKQQERVVEDEFGSDIEDNNDIEENNKKKRDNENPEKSKLFLKPFYSKLKHCNKALKEYNNINLVSKTLYEKYSDYFKDLTNKSESIKDITRKIEDLYNKYIEVKNKRIIESFNNINENFNKYFKELIPNGSARLKLLSEDNIFDNMSNKNTTQVITENLFSNNSSAKIEVIANYGNSESQFRHIDELSGGQKTVISLAIKFAFIDEIKPPFFVLDEVDSALDQNIKANLANLIKKISFEKGIQFFICSFKPEIMGIADRIFEINFSNKVSSIRKVTTEYAINFCSKYR